MHDETVVIQKNGKVNGKYCKLTFQSSSLSRKIKPGQFLNVHIDPVTFLRRPFSYYRTDGNQVEILYEVLGKGTEILSRKKKGDVLRVMGPLGKAFTQELRRRKRILVAGGIGVPPLVFLAERNPTHALLIGTKTKDEILPKRELKNVKAQIEYTTNDGSYGTEGNVTVLLGKILKEISPKEIFIQTCGPRVMMKTVMKIAKRYKIPGEASIDQSMACGVGACLGCMVKTTRGLVPSCTEGPVFSFEELDYDC
ncbi:MAG: dihydroorotate dehydrogenase electron transfer subunit [Candidatus Omnitrophica bacterium]|nr:dihydroorotate dehydrogenase electron transfer subunit [Candidatus Omnitrophota bacterium]